MTTCRVCSTPLPQPAYTAPAPALTSITTLLAIPTQVYVCPRCSHAQCDALPDVNAFYDHDYRISLRSAEHDQIVSVQPDGTVLYRTDHQAALVQRLLPLPAGARILDYGAAKADTLRKLHAARPDLQPHVFDVSADYAPAWQGWVPNDAQATYTVPAAWDGYFDAIMSHFVIEHVPEPVAFVRTLARLLKPEGTLLLSLPDALRNPGDLMVVDHVNHFSLPSLQTLLAQEGLTLVAVDDTAFPGAFFAVARRDSAAALPAASDIAATLAQAQALCQSWHDTARHVQAAAQAVAGQRVAIYGAGFYGSWIYSQVREQLTPVCFVDRNPHLQGSTQFGIPVLHPDQLPQDIDVVFIGLNPQQARKAIADVPTMQRTTLQRVWLDGQP